MSTVEPLPCWKECGKDFGFGLPAAAAEMSCSSFAITVTDSHSMKKEKNFFCDAWQQKAKS